MTNSKPKNYFLVKRNWQKSDIFEMFDEPFDKRSAWLYLVENAAWKGRKFMVGNNVFDLERGQFSCSIRYLATAWKWSNTKVSSYLKILEKFEMIKVTKKTGQNLITICNYSKYQIGEIDEKTVIDTDTSTDERQLEDSHWDKTNIDKYNIKTDKEGNKKTKQKKFSPPTLDQIHEYFIEIGVSSLEFAETFFDHYQGNGWKVGGKSPMKDWKATCRNWKRRENQKVVSSRNQQTESKKQNPFGDILDQMDGKQPQPDFENMKTVSPNYKSEYR